MYMRAEEYIELVLHLESQLLIVISRLKSSETCKIKLIQENILFSGRCEMSTL